MPTAGQVLVSSLVSAGVTRYYGVPGESYLEVLDAVQASPDARLISTRHEPGASFAAEADAKTSRRPAAAMATRAVGASNLAIGVHTAHQDSTPMIVLIGQAATAHLGREAFQEVDLPDFYRQITKHAVTVHRPDRIAEYAARAVEIATSGRPGPVLLALPEDVLGADTGDAPPWAAGPPARPGQPSPEQMAHAAALLADAARPVIIAGEACKGHETALLQVAEHYGAGVYAAFRRQDLFPNDHPQYLGHLGLDASPTLRRALDDADVVLALGTRLDQITTDDYRQPPRSAAVIQVYPAGDVIGRSVPVSAGVVADVGLTLSELLKVRGQAVTRDWSAGRQAVDDHRRVGPSRAREGLLDPAVAVRALQAGYGEANPIVTNDAGNFAAFLHRHWAYRVPDSQVAPVSGAMGYAVPAALGAKLAAPDREVLAVAGDGGFLMTGQELETAARVGAPFVVAVFRNGLYGTIAMHQARRIGRLAGVDIGDVDVAAFARSLGCAGHTVTTAQELTSALAAARAAKTPAVLDILIDPRVLSPTMVTGDLTAGQ